jgi:hypothetical protein
MSRRHQVQGSRPGDHPPPAVRRRSAAPHGEDPTTRRHAVICIAGCPGQAPGPRARAGKGGALAVASSAQALLGRAPWRWQEEEEQGRWGWAVEPPPPPLGGAREEGKSYLVGGGILDMCV